MTRTEEAQEEPECVKIGYASKVRMQLQQYYASIGTGKMYLLSRVHNPVDSYCYGSITYGKAIRSQGQIN